MTLSCVDPFGGIWCYKTPLVESGGVIETEAYHLVWSEFDSALYYLWGFEYSNDTDLWLV